MNKADRKQVSEIVSKLEALKAEAESLGETLRELGSAEQEKYDNMPEGLQGGEAGQAIETAASALDSAADALETGNVGDALDELGNIEL
jgi:hypothetical protein